MNELNANGNKKKTSSLRKKLATSRSVRRRSERLRFVLPKTSRSLLTSLITQEVQEEAAHPMEYNQLS